MSDLPTLRGIATDILSYRGDELSNTALARGQGYTATGLGIEEAAYGTSAEITEQNAVLAGIAGEIQQYQERRNLVETVGTQRAQLAASGFKESGSGLASIRSSFQQGYLADQLIATQTALTRGGYLEQAAASRSDKAAAGVARDAALALQQEYETSATTSKATAARETKALMRYFTESGLAETPEAQLTLATLGEPTELPAGWVRDAKGMLSYNSGSAIDTLPRVGVLASRRPMGGVMAMRRKA